MSRTVPSAPDRPDPSVPPRSARAEAVAALHLLALRRQCDKIRALFGDDPPPRAREVLWVALEAALAQLRGERIAQRDLVARAEGLLSGPTLSRAVADAERADLLVSEPALEHARLRWLRPTARTLRLLEGRADAAFAEFATIVDAVREAERRSPPRRRPDGTASGEAEP